MHRMRLPYRVSALEVLRHADTEHRIVLQVRSRGLMRCPAETPPVGTGDLLPPDGVADVPARRALPTEKRGEKQRDASGPSSTHRRSSPSTRSAADQTIDEATCARPWHMETCTRTIAPRRADTFLVHRDRLDRRFRRR